MSKPEKAAKVVDEECGEAGVDIKHACPHARLTRLFLILGCLLLIVKTCTHCMQQQQGPSTALISPDCLLPLGGGAAAKGGSFAHFSYESCKSQLDLYFAEDGAYYSEVQHVAEAAKDFLKQKGSQTPSSWKQVFVFDIDETVLSNADEWMTTPRPTPTPTPTWWKAWFPSATPASPTPTQHAQEPAADTAGAAGSSGPKVFKGLPAALRGELEDATDRPPLLAVRELYWWLLQSNYSVAFITGRKESARQATAHNLLAAGYGKPCTSHSQMTPCYVALHLRDEDDDRPASVYKPERRKALMDAGYEVVGNVGDQFSDLEGLWVAESSWKLPNPMYYIL